MTTAATQATRTSQSSRITGPVSARNLLRAGSSGAEVKLLQRALSAAGLKVPVNGRFDAKTEAAVRSYQRSKGLQVDGLVGQQTWGSFVGKSYPPGTNLLKGNGGVSGPSAPGRRGGSSPTQQTGFDDSNLGPSKQVDAYAGGRPIGKISVVSVGSGEYLRADAARAWKSMQAAASRAGINLGVTDGFRTMSEQQELYRRYQNGTGNLAARPGYSNHQNGIAIDISGINGRGTAADRWLSANAGRFGFRNLPAEFWHFDYVG